MHRNHLRSLVSAVVLAAGAQFAVAQVGTAVTYQGQLKNSGTPVSAQVDIRFSIWDAATAGSQVGAIDTKTNVTVTDGLFSTTFDCGANPYTADAARWLQIEVRNPSNVGGFVLLGSRQRLTAAPFSAATRGINVSSSGAASVAALRVGSNVIDHESRSLIVKRNQLQDIYLSFQDDDSAVNEWEWRGDDAARLSLWAGFDQRVTFQQNGNVGIGINIPTDKLHVKGGRLRVDQTDGVTGSGVVVMSNGTTDNYIYTAAGTGDLVLDTQSPADNLIFAPNGGNVGIGTGATAGTKVHMSQPFILNGFSTNLLLRQPIASWGLGPEFANYRYIQTQAAAPDFDGNFRQFNVAPGGVSIGYPNTPAYGSADAMYINGNVGIGTSSPTVGFKLDVNGNIRCVSLTQTSTRDFKQNITPLSGALESIMKLQGVTYAWNDQAPEQVRGSHDIGFLADEMNDVLPDIVAKDASGKPIGIDYGKVTPVAVEAIKQLKNENNALKARLERLEALVAAQTPLAAANK